MRPRNVPWTLVRQAYRNFRNTYFTVSVPRHKGSNILVRADIDEVRKTFGKDSYAPNWEFSYRYEGEDLNLAKVRYSEYDHYPDIVWWQTHIRGWDVEGVDGTILHAHEEPEPTEHPDAHLEERGFDVSKGFDRVRTFLTKNAIDHEPFEWTDDQVAKL